MLNKLSTLIPKVIRRHTVDQDLEYLAPPRSLTEATLQNTPRLGLSSHGARVPAKVLRVVDGDTMDVAVAVFGGIYLVRVRLSGIDTPESRPALRDPDRDATVVAARRSADFVRDHVEGREVAIVIGDAEKFGRLLCDIYYPPNADMSLNETLVKEGLAKRYDGGSKATCK